MVSFYRDSGFTFFYTPVMTMAQSDEFTYEIVYKHQSLLMSNFTYLIRLHNKILKCTVREKRLVY